jgi:uncharacterized protein with ParB-like and HNH nuclease domain
VKSFIHNLKEIFSKDLDIDGKKNLIINIDIPFFQRSYVWTHRQVSQFIEEIDEVIKNKTKCFMGTIIRKITNGRCMLIDGQQRITTLVLFLKVLTIYKSEYIDEFNKIFQYQYGYEVKCKFQVSKTDLFLFNSLINEDNIYKFPSTALNSRLKEAYEFLTNPELKE